MDKEMFSFYRNALIGSLTGEPICDEYKSEWRVSGENKAALMRLAMRQQSLPYIISHCYNGLGLTKEYLVSEFSEYINGRGKISDVDDAKGYTYQMYVGFSDISSISRDVSAFMWCNCPSIVIKATKCPILYVGVKSDLHLSLDGYNSVVIYLFDESKVTIEDADETCSVIIYRYSTDASVEKGKFCICENIKTFDKTLKL